MSFEIEIVTNSRVRDLLIHLNEVKGLRLVGEIDSVNHGEGYDFKYDEIGVRLYDDVRSDWVIANKKNLSWDQAFELATEKFLNDVSLTIEIDRYGQYPKAENKVVSDAIYNKLSEKGFQVKQKEI